MMSTASHGTASARSPAAARALAPEALDFAPGLLSIQESPPARLPRTVLYTVSGLFLIVLLWASFGRLDIIASADGRLVPQSYVKIVQPADAGIVQEILVKEGEQVAAGQVLLRMDHKEAQADEQTLKTELALRALELRRIDAELSGLSFVAGTDAPPDLAAQVAAQYHERRQAYLDASAQARDALHKAQRDYRSGQEELAKLNEVTPILKAQAQAYTDMGKDGYAPQLTVRDKQREYLEKSRDRAAQEETVASLAAAVAQAQSELAQITSKYRSDLENERIDTESQHRKLQQDYAKQLHKVGLLELKAPQAGIVKDLATHTIGTVVSSGTVLLSLVPEHEPLVAEVQVKNDDVGFVYAQQHVKIKLAAYPFQKYGMLEGEVVRVGPDASETDPTPQARARSAENPSAPELTYKALIRLDAQTLEAHGEQLKLVPGMELVAEINQGSRTVMDYLLSPVAKTLHESGHER